MAVAAIAVRGFRRKLPNRVLRRLLPLKTANFLDRANADRIGFAQGAIDGTCFGDAHLGSTYQWRDIARRCIAEAAESAAFVGPEYGRFKHPARFVGLTKLLHHLHANSATPFTTSDTQ